MANEERDQVINQGTDAAKKTVSGTANGTKKVVRTGSGLVKGGGKGAKSSMLLSLKVKIILLAVLAALIIIGALVQGMSSSSFKRIYRHTALGEDTYYNDPTDLDEAEQSMYDKTLGIEDTLSLVQIIHDTRQKEYSQLDENLRARIQKSYGDMGVDVDLSMQNAKREYADASHYLYMSASMGGASGDTQTAIQNAINWAVMIANDDSWVYPPQHQAGCYLCGKCRKKEYTCMPFITAAYAHGAGDPEIMKICKRGGSLSTQDSAWKKNSCFELVGRCKDLNYEDLQPGDVLVQYSSNDDQGHMCMFIGDGKLVHAAGRKYGICVTSNAKKTFNSYKKGSSRMNPSEGHLNFVMRYVGQGGSGSTATASEGQKIVDTARRYIGKVKYVKGGTSLTKGIDCTGFVWRIYNLCGYSDMDAHFSRKGTSVGTDINNAQPGDVIKYAHHWAIYSGNKKIIHAAGPEYGVIEGSYRAGGKVLDIRRYVKASSSASASSSSLNLVANATGVTSGGKSKSVQDVINGACAWAEAIAADNSFHYGACSKSHGSGKTRPKVNSSHTMCAHHNGCYFCGTNTNSDFKYIVDKEKTYCCNPFVHAAFAHGGGEPTMLKVCKKGSSYSFKKGEGYDTSKLFKKMGKLSVSKLQKGDVLCTDSHAMLYIGDGKIAEAAGRDDNVKGSTKWNNSIHVTKVKSSDYDRVYRYIGTGGGTMEMPSGAGVSSSGTSAASLPSYTSVHILGDIKQSDGKIKHLSRRGSYQIGQSFALTNDGNFAVAWATQPATTKVCVSLYDSNGGHLTDEYANGYHANGSTVSSEGEIWIGGWLTGSSKNVARLTTSGNSLSSAGSKSLPARSSAGIAYDKQTGKYIFGAGGTIRIYDSSLSKCERKITKKHGTYYQDMGAGGGIIYSCHSVKKGNLRSGSAKNYVDLYRESDGAYLGSYFLDYGELESCVIKDGELVLLVHVKGEGRCFIQWTGINLVGDGGSQGSAQASYVSRQDMDILAAYNVSLANTSMYLDRSSLSDGNTNGWLDSNAYRDVANKKVKLYWFGKNRGQINYERDFKSKVDSLFKDSGDFFYKFTFANKVEKITTTDANGNKVTKRYIPVTVAETDVENLMEPMFGIKPNAGYVNAAGIHAAEEDADDRTAIYPDEVSDASAENIAATSLTGEAIAKAAEKYAWPKDKGVENYDHNKGGEPYGGSASVASSLGFKKTTLYDCGGWAKFIVSSVNGKKISGDFMQTGFNSYKEKVAKLGFTAFKFNGKESSLKRGDILTYKKKSKGNSTGQHVYIYLGNGLVAETANNPKQNKHYYAHITTLSKSKLDMSKYSRYYVARVAENSGSSSSSSSASNSNKAAIQRSIEWARKIAADNRFTYGKGYGDYYDCPVCHGSTKTSELKYTCNPFVAAAFAHGTKDPLLMNNGRHKVRTSDWNFEGNRSKIWKKVGLCKDLSWSDIQPGDIFIKYASGVGGHACIYGGGDELIEATSGSGITDKKSGAKKRFKSYQKGNKNFVMRYIGSGSGASTSSSGSAAASVNGWTGKSSDGKCYLGNAASTKNMSQSGDQDGKEVLVSKCGTNWDYVIRWNDASKALAASKIMYDACKNDHVGYNNKNKAKSTSFYKQLVANKGDASAISKNCDTACSQMVAAILRYLGVDLDDYVNAKALYNTLKKKSEFTVYSSKDYTKSTSKLRPGDVLLRVNGNNHAAMVVQTKNGMEGIEAYSGPSNQSVINGALAWARKIAADDSWTYGHGSFKCCICNNMKIKQFTCMPFIAAAYAHGGGDPIMMGNGTHVINLHDGNFKGDLGKIWKKVGLCKNLTLNDLQPGDVVIKWADDNAHGHAWMYGGGDEVIEATGNGGIHVVNGAAERLKSYGTSSKKDKNYVMRYVGGSGAAEFTNIDFSDKGTNTFAAATNLEATYSISDVTGRTLFGEMTYIDNLEEFYSPSELGGGTLTGGVVVSSNMQRRILEYLEKNWSSRNPWNCGYAHMCEKWVCDVYKAAGVPTNGDCCAAHDRAKNAITDVSEIPPGAMIYSDPNVYRSTIKCGNCGRNAGHVAIYISPDKIIGSQPQGVMTLEQWGKAFGFGGWSFSGNTPPSTGGSVSSAAISSGNGSKSDFQNYAKSLLGNHGWSSSEMTPLIKLWNRESGWNPNAHNKSSGAHGIPQSLPASKMKSEGADYYTNGYTQIRWGLKYIKSRYGSPTKAWAHSQKYGWY